MRFNKYTLKIKNGNKTILYNVITKIMLEIDCNITNVENEFFKNLTKEDEQLYKEKLLISDDDNDDILQMEKIKHTYNHQNEIGHFLIHLGYACNLKCTYCYQSTIESSDKIAKINSQKVVEFIAKSAKINNFDMYDICFIGGEPLIYYPEIIEISSALNSLLGNKDIFYSVVTNGTLLNDKYKINNLIKNGILDYQITIDGPQNQHDKYRNNGKEGSFSQIIKNIENILHNFPNIYLSLNCNLTEENSQSIDKLFQYLDSKKINIPIMFSMVFDNGKNISLECHSHNTIWKDAHKTALKYGQQYTPFYRDLYLGCALTQENYFIIGADGKLYKCINAINNKKYCVGDMENYGSKEYNDKIKKFLKYEINQKMCKECELYPVCFGGCEYRNSINGFQCDKKLFHENEIDIIRMIANAGN